MSQLTPFKVMRPSSYLPPSSTQNEPAYLIRLPHEHMVGIRSEQLAEFKREMDRSHSVFGACYQVPVHFWILCSSLKLTCV